MAKQAVFAGLVIDENDHTVNVAYVGEEPCYVVDDNGFLRHIPSEMVDRQVFTMMKEQIDGNEGLISEQTAKMLGEDDIFSRAMIENQLKKIGDQFDNLMATGIPEEGRAYMGMMGFKIVINVHGEVVELRQPSAPAPDGEGE